MATNNSNKNRPSNFVIFTLRAIREGEVRFTNNGEAMAKVRAFLSQGKDKDTGEYKPSLFFDVLAVSNDDNTTPVIDALSAVKNGSYFTVKGNLTMKEWAGNDGVKYQQLAIFAKSVEPFSFENEPADSSEDEIPY
jgi:single-stranded DNA-binding protein